MIRRKLKTKKVIFLTFLLILTMSSIFTIFPLNLSNSENFNKTDNNDVIQPLLSQAIGEDPWWDISYQWRQCLNITNPGSYNLTENFVSIEFDYTALGTKIRQADLTDLRIVENNVVRNYYVKKNFPTIGRATVWFETNSTAGMSDYDTYMYFGNSSITDRGVTHVNYDPSGTSWWSFEEGSGTQGSNVMDSLDYANATLWGRTGSDYPVHDADSAVGSYSLNFDGSNDFVYINDELHFENPNEIPAVTVSCWFKTSYSSTLDYTYNWAFFDFDRSEYFNFYIDCDSNANGGTTEGRIGFSSSASGYGGQNDFYGLTTDLNDGEWHFASIVYDGSDKIIYIDGGIEDNRWVNAMGGRAFGTGLDRWGFFGEGSEADSENESGGRNNRYYEGNLDEIRYFEYAVAPDEIQWLANYYPIETNLLPVTERSVVVTIVVEDVDGKRVPGTKVSLWDNLTHILEVGSTTYTDLTLSDGTVSFTKVPYGFYNITANYTLISELYEEKVYDSRESPGGEVEFKGLIASTTVTANLWTIEFEVEDWDGDPLDYGYVEVSNNTIEVLESLPLDSAGETTFRWVNTSSYNYTIYYDNPDYTPHPTSLNSSTITRSGPPMNYTELVRTPLSKLDIRVMDSTGKEGVNGVTIKVQLNNTAQDVVDLETDTTGYAYGASTQDFGFWYLTEQAYNFTLWIVSLQQSFIVNTSDKPKPPSYTTWYNYSLDHAISLVFLLDLNFTQRIANFTNIIGDTGVIWGDNMTFSVVYETSNNSGQTWVPDWNLYGFATSATWTIYSKYGQKLLEQLMVQGSTIGSFSITVNSSLFSVAEGAEFYYASVSGYKPFWNDPGDIYFGITIFARPTGITLHNYTSIPNELPKNIGGDYDISEYYGFKVNISAKFFDNDTTSVLIPESFTYEWDYGSGSLLPGPLLGYYTLEIDTLAATNVGKYWVDITANLENYTSVDDFGFYIDILSRPTKINGSSGIFYVSENIYIFEAIDFIFDYEDEFTTNPISNLDEKSFLLQKLDGNGDPIPGTTEIGSLVETGDNKFLLDLDTELRVDGEYSIIITLDKLNYDYRIAIISFTIMKREIYISDFLNYREIASGASVDFTMTIIDLNNETSPGVYAPIIGANGNLTIGGIDYPLIELGNGIYRVSTPALADAFFTPQTFTATLTIEKQYFSTKEESITIVVKMQEIFGIPTFYFLMIVGAVVAVVGSLAAYRIILQRRIPTFVKKAKQMKKNIKGKKAISDSLLYPSKEEYIVKKLGDKWEDIGLSLGDIMGVKGKKKKKLPEIKEGFKGGAV